MSASLFIYIAVFLISGIALGILREVMLTQVNRNLPDEGKIRRTPWSRTGLKSGEESRLWEVHEQTHPHSLLRLSCLALWIFIPIWMFFGLNLLQRFAWAR